MEPGSVGLALGSGIQLREPRPHPPQDHQQFPHHQFQRTLHKLQEHTLAVGDDTNDLAMLTWAGHGVAMPHANGETRISADEVLVGEGTQALVEYLNQIAAKASGATG